MKETIILSEVDVVSLPYSQIYSLCFNEAQSKNNNFKSKKFQIPTCTLHSSVNAKKLSVLLSIVFKSYVIY
jgi:hypothetical protein